MPEGAIRVGRRLWIVRFKLPINSSEFEYFAAGFRYAADAVADAVPGEEAIVVEISKLKLVDTDFQPEALFGVALLWCTEEFGIRAPDIDGSYDRAQHVYHLSVDGEPLTQSWVNSSASREWE